MSWLLIEQSLKFAFRVSYNQEEYEALSARMWLVTNMGVRRLIVRIDSQLVTEQLTGNLQARDHT